MTNVRNRKIIYGSNPCAITGGVLTVFGEIGELKRGVAR